MGAVMDTATVVSTVIAAGMPMVAAVTAMAVDRLPMVAEFTVTTRVVHAVGIAASMVAAASMAVVVVSTVVVASMVVAAIGKLSLIDES